MKFASRVFLGESIAGDPGRIIRKIKKRKFTMGTYILSPAENGVDPIEYYDAKQLLQPYYKDKELYVLGIARSEEEAAELVLRIYEASVEYGHPTVRSYVEELFS